jgi:DNA-binding XRE family transcriptional regulator
VLSTARDEPAVDFVIFAGSHPVVCSVAQRHYQEVPTLSKYHRSKPLVALGAAIRRARKMACLSQEGLAQAVDMDRSYIGAVERGENVISIIALLRIADVLQTTGSELLKDVTL